MTTGDFARMRSTSDSAEPGCEVLLTEASYPSAQTYNPTGFVHDTGGDGGCGEGMQGDAGQ